MKKKWMSYGTALAAAALLLFAGCSNISGGLITGEKPGNGLSASESETPVVTATINGITDAESLQAQLSSRTLLPTPQAIDTGLIYVLEGTSTNGNHIAAQKVTVTANAATNNNEITISFPDTATWELTLTAYKTAADTGVQPKDYKDGNDEATASDPVLTATTEVSFAGGTPSIAFNMNVKGLETPGSVAIDATSGFVYTGSSVAITKYEIGLYDIITGAPIQTTANAAATTGKVSVTTAAGTVNFTADTTSLADVAPGEYVLGVTFYNTYNSNDYQVGFWSDYVVVAPGQTSTFTEIITGIDEKPAEPENFKAERVANSEANNTYLVKLTWDDTATNESNYEIDLYEVADSAKDTALTTTSIKTAANATKLATLGFASLYSSEDATAKKVVDFKDGSLYYGGGSLFASSESATLKLDTGKLYEVVIRAVKSAVDSSADVARGESTAATGYKAATNHINRLRLSYIAAPYTITVDSDSAQQYVTYATYEGAAIALLTGSDFTLAYKGTSVAEENFKGWISASDGKTSVTSTDYQNVTVLADVAFDIAALVDTYTYSTDVDDSFVALTAFTGDSDSTGTALTITDKVASVNASDKDRITVSADAAATGDYTSYIIALDGYLYTQEQSCTMYLNRLATGSHNILVAGEKADASGKTTLYSYSFTLKVVR